MLVCGRYEGFDERVRSFVDEEISLGDFVMTGGEVAAMAVIEATVRLLPGVLGNAESIREESHGEDGLLEYPQYTRPAEFRGLARARGAHGRQPRRDRALATRSSPIERTRERRPDLLAMRSSRQEATHEAPRDRARAPPRPRREGRRS